MTDKRHSAVNIKTRDISFKASHERYCVARYFAQSYVNNATWQDISSNAYHERHRVARYFVHRSEKNTEGVLVTMRKT